MTHSFLKIIVVTLQVNSLLRLLMGKWWNSRSRRESGLPNVNWLMCRYIFLEALLWKFALVPQTRWYWNLESQASYLQYGVGTASHAEQDNWHIWIRANIPQNTIKHCIWYCLNYLHLLGANGGAITIITGSCIYFRGIGGVHWSSSIVIVVLLLLFNWRIISHNKLPYLIQVLGDILWW